MLFFMNWIRFTNRLFGARIQIKEPDRVQFETNEPIQSCDSAINSDTLTLYLLTLRVAMRLVVMDRIPANVTGLLISS